MGNMFDYEACGTISPNFFFGRLAMGGQATEGRINKFTNSEALFTARLAYRDEQMSHIRRWKDDGHHIPNISWALHKWITVITNTYLNVHLRWPNFPTKLSWAKSRNKGGGCSHQTSWMWRVLSDWLFLILVARGKTRITLKWHAGMPMYI